MRSEQHGRGFIDRGTVAMAIVSIVVTIAIAQAQSHDVFRFRGPNGAAPYSSLTEDASGNLYGTTSLGGQNDCGTIFKLDTAGKETVLYRFGKQATDGCNPASGVTFDGQGNLYGTTVNGGVNGLGTVYKLASSGQETVLYNFGFGLDGQNPASGLVRDKKGNLYGTTYYGGANAIGTIFRLTPSGEETVLHDFGADGAYPISQPALMRDAQGNLYGTTSQGGAFSGGSVFKLDPAGTLTVLYNLGGYVGDGYTPYAGVVRDKAGNLYGATWEGGNYFLGILFKLDPSGNETVLHNFGGGFDGQNPYGGVILDKRGNLYGVTTLGGIGLCEGGLGCGTVFKVDKTGQESVLHAFESPNVKRDGANPDASLTLDPTTGALYGTTTIGGGTGCGGSGCGTVFRLIP